MEYCSTEGENILRTSCTRRDMSPYRAKLEENTATWPFSTISRILNRGSPILMPRALASSLRATAQPSLLDSTMTGFPYRSGRKTRSHEAKKLLQSARANIRYIFLMT